MPGLFVIILATALIGAAQHEPTRQNIGNAADKAGKKIEKVINGN